MATATNPKAAVVKTNAPRPAHKPAPKAEVVEYKPEESVWQEFSAHNEFPLSFGASLIIHVFLILFAALVVRDVLFADDSKESPKVDNIMFIGGGGGSGAAGGDPLAPKDRKEAAIREKYKDPETGITIRPEDIAKLTPSELDRMIEKAKTEADKAHGLAEKARREGEPGQGGTGSGGGKGSGKGPGVGPGVGPGNAPEELERWILTISYRAGRDYLLKLAGLEVILVIPIGENKYRVYKDLSVEKPGFSEMTNDQVMDAVKGRLELEIDDEKNIRGLADQLEFAPPQVVSLYMPLRSSMFDELRKKELAFKGKTLAQIRDQRLVTQFDLNRVGDRWEIRVIRQYAAK